MLVPFHVLVHSFCLLFWPSASGSCDLRFPCASPVSGISPGAVSRFSLSASIVSLLFPTFARSLLFSVSAALAIFCGTNLWPFMSYQRTLMVVFLRLVGVHSVELQQPREYVVDAQHLYERLIVVVFVAIVFV